MGQVSAARPKGAAVPSHEPAGELLLAAYDWKHDGFGGSPKVPQPAASEFLLALGLREGTPLALKAALRSLAVLPKSELADPVEGGFFDRCAGPGWREPFTRKSLAVNASLLHAMATAGAWARDASLLAAAASTAKFIEELMGQDDSDLWVSAFAPDDEYYAKMGHRRARGEPPPAEGPASVADNARALSAMLRAGVCLDEPRLLARAKIAGRELMDGHIPAALADRAAKAVALSDLAVVTGDAAWLKEVGQLRRSVMGEVERAREPEAARWIAAVILSDLRSASQTEGGALSHLSGLAEALSAEGGTYDERAVVALAQLAARGPGLDANYTGPPPSAAEATAARAALAATWAVGAPSFAAKAGPRQAGGRPEVWFVSAKASSRAVTDPKEVREALRGVLPIREAL